jgi:hypothetical protein
VIAIVAGLAWCGGFLMASAPAFGYAKLNAWRSFGENFQLGYVVGFVDGITLWKRSDRRGASFPIGGKPNYELLRDKVNEFFADPANANRALVDAMAVIGAQMSLERLNAFKERAARTPGAASSPGAPGTSAAAAKPSAAPPAAPAATETRDR